MNFTEIKKYLNKKIMSFNIRINIPPFLDI